MPLKRTIDKSRQKKRAGKPVTTQAGEFVREELHKLHHGRGGARGPKSKKQAIAIGLSEARRSGIEVAPPAKGKAKSGVQKKAKADLEKGRRASKSTVSRPSHSNGVTAPSGKTSSSRSRAVSDRRDH